MKGRIWKDERYPDYGISDKEPESVEIPDELFSRWQRVNVAYDLVQTELETLYKQLVQKGRE